MSLEAEVRDRLRPDREERHRMGKAVAALKGGLQGNLESAGLPGEATVQGSVAKDTWLAGSTDIDVFVMLPPEVDDERLDGLMRTAVDGVLEDAQAKYAQHPYLIGSFQGFDVDVVPAYRVARPGKRLSAVDRTPFHTQWVREQMDAEDRDEVRLAKQWMKGIEVYGAETAIAGFSGYLVEVLVHRFGGFSGLVDWLAGGATPRRIALGADDVDDPVSPLIIVDPVDPERNCAAAVSEGTLADAIEAARAYRDAPSQRFFFPRPAEAASADRLHAVLSERGQAWFGIAFPDAAERLDLVAPQFQKATRRIADELARAGFAVAASRTDIMEPVVGMQWLVAAEPLPATRLHTGPPVGTTHADRFEQKWQGHPDAAAPVRDIDGRLAIDITIHHRTPAAWLAAHLEELPLGKHVHAAMQRATVMEDPGDVPSPWSPRVTDFILQRRPWQR